MTTSENTVRACKRIIIALVFGFITLRPDMNAGLSLIAAGASIYNLSVAFRYLTK